MIPSEAALSKGCGSPDEETPVTDEQWSRKGDVAENTSNWGVRRTINTSGTGGPDAMIAFEGTSTIISGFNLATGSTAGCNLDGELDRTAGPYSDEDGPRAGNRAATTTVWMTAGSDGSEITLSHPMVFR